MRRAPSLALLGALALHAFVLLGPWFSSAAPEPAAPVLKIKTRLVSAPAASVPVSKPAPSEPPGRAVSAASAVSEQGAFPAAPLPEPKPEAPAASVPTLPETAPPVPASLEPDRYRRLIREAVAEQKKYPYAARVRGQQGTAVVRFVLDPSGALLSPPLIVRSSGVPRLDEAARNAVAAASPYLPPPPGFEASFDLAVEFVLNSSP